MSPFLHADWPAPPGVHGLTTLRHGAGRSRPPFDSFNLGNRFAADGDDAATVEANRAELAGIDDGIAPEPEADASVTSDRGVALAILTADCLPVLFAARDGSEVAAAHAGWRGLAAGMLEATVAAMRTPADEVIAWLGPAAGPDNYEVGVEVYDAFVADDWPCGSAFVSTRPHHWRVDLYALARRRLERAGLRAADIHGGGLCTIGDPARFFSHRRDGRSGRIASLVWIDP